MERIFGYVLALHIVAGTTGLVVAPLAMITIKGGGAHRFWGRVFFWAMCVLAVTAVFLSWIHPNILLFAIAFFSFQFAATGYRAIYHKPVAGQVRMHWLDWVPIGLAVLAGGILLWIAAALSSSHSAFLWVTLFFGLLSLFTAYRQARTLLRPSPDPKAWWYAHMRGMLASYIAMVSAFSVVNFSFLPPVVRWLWPSLVGVPLIVVWIRYYRRKFQRNAPAVAST